MMKKILIMTLSIFVMETLMAEQLSDEAQLRHIKSTLWPQAYRTQDEDLLATILHPKFQLIDASGNTSNRQQELQYIRANPWTAVNFKYHIERLDVFAGHTAMISGRGETDSYSYHSSNVLIKHNGRWQAIASHVSGFQQKTETTPD